MAAYGDIERAIAGLMVGVAGAGARRVKGAYIAAEEIDFGDPVFGYAGTDDLIYKIARDTGTITLDANLVTSNVITTNVTLDGVAQTEVATTFDTDHDTTMEAHRAALEAAITGLTVTLTDATNNRQFTLFAKGKNINTITSVVTLGASQAGITIAYTTAQIFLGVAAYTARQSYSASTEIGRYNAEDSVNVLVDGEIYVNSGGAVNSNSNAYVVLDPASANQGKFTGSSSGTYNVNCVFTETVAAAGLVKVEVNELYDGPA